MADTGKDARASKPSDKRPGTRLRDRPEFDTKPAPVTFRRDARLSEAIAVMAEKNIGAVVITDEAGHVEGVLTERDVLRRVVNAGRDPKETTLAAVMTPDPRTAREDDDMLEWLRIMSNERFRRLPVVDEEGKLIQVLTQGDFVSYTWPDLLHQARLLGRATLAQNFHPTLIMASIVVYPLLVLLIFGVFAG